MLPNPEAVIDIREFACSFQLEECVTLLVEVEVLLVGDFEELGLVVEEVENYIGVTEDSGTLETKDLVEVLQNFTFREHELWFDSFVKSDTHYGFALEQFGLVR